MSIFLKITIKKKVIEKLKNNLAIFNFPNWLSATFKCGLVEHGGSVISLNGTYKWYNIIKMSTANAFEKLSSEAFGLPCIHFLPEIFSNDDSIRVLSYNQCALSGTIAYLFGIL
jgi:hypothetical protein